MGGSILVESREGHGSCFTARLPLAPAPQDGSAASPPHTEPLDASFARKHPLKVMVVEDDRVNRLLIQSLLRKLGYDAAVAENGKDAIRLFQVAQPDCILTDVQMPMMDGIELARAIRAGEKNASSSRRVAVIAVTANILPADRQLCNRGGNGCLPEQAH